MLFLENWIPDRLLLLQQFSLRKSDVADHELTGKHSAFFHCNGPCRDIAFQRAFPIDRDRLRRDLTRHLASDFDAFCADSAEAVNIGFAIDNDVPSADAPRNFASVVNRRGFVAMQIPAQPAFN